MRDRWNAREKREKKKQNRKDYLRLSIKIFINYMSKNRDKIINKRVHFIITLLN